MKIMIIGASGKQGRQLLAEAQRRNHEVTAVVRDKNKLSDTNCEVLEKDLFELTYDDVKEQDVIISAFGTWTPETHILHKDSAVFLANLLSGKSNRLLFVGGAGSLYTDEAHTQRLMDAPDFPESYYPTASNMALGLDEIKKRDDVNWTYLSPSADFDAEGVRTGNYRVGGEVVLFNAKGDSYISYADFAVAMLDEAEQGKHIKKRFTVVSE
ncbi:NAD(P)-dependent oxidoreductase [Oscillibacter sp.]|uniref:NAD(P)-dependent oxidoreductase n=1 Tax=Oscillibacter sp. TaxID=1945593 RepID=UPI00289B4688|nr:NAD(P)-dependent oxidoreductase [Oscillibacter sp.]